MPSVIRDKLVGMSEFTAEQVAHLAALSRIALSESELASLTNDLSQIVTAVEAVNQVATPDVPATSHPIPMQNVFRADEVGETLTPDQALAAAPDRYEDYFRVPTILGEEQ